MGMLAYDGALRVGATGVTVAAGAVSANTAIPNTTSGNRARAVLLTSIGNVHVRFGNGAGTTATTNDLLIASDTQVVYCQPFDRIAYIQNSAAATLNITPLET